MPQLDPSAAYLVVRERLSAALAGLPDDRAGLPVPACPRWTVRETVAHLAGACADILAGRVEDAGSEAWTARQVDAAGGRPLADLLADWAGTGPQVAALLAAAPKIMGQVVMDGVSHEYDLYEALGLPLPSDAAGGDPVLAAALEWVAPRFLRNAEKAGFPPFRLVAGDRSWTYRDGGDPQATLTGTELQLLRAVTGRLTETGIRSLAWDADPQPWLPTFTWAVFRPAAA
jgi:uncharacterized protein (TIGR03083 family)